MKCQENEWRKYFKEHREESRIRCKQRHERKREEINAKQREEYGRNPTPFLSRNKKWRQENPEKWRQGRRKWLRADICNKIGAQLRVRLCMAIRNGQKVGSAVRDLGCSVPFLKKYLESRFEEGMNWENWGVGSGKWHIDHITPLSKIDLTDREQFLKASHYTNLQPLWALDNIRKSGG